MNLYEKLRSRIKQFAEMSFRAVCIKLEDDITTSRDHRGRLSVSDLQSIHHQSAIPVDHGQIIVRVEFEPYRKANHDRT